MTAVQPDGTTVSRKIGPDPQWRVAGQVLEEETITLPSGLTRLTSVDRQVELAQAFDPFSLLLETTSTTVNGQTFTEVFDAETLETTTTSPLGRSQVTTLNAQGQVIRRSVPGLLPIDYIYDPQGRLTDVVQGDRTTSMSYGSDGYLETMSNGLLEQETLFHDLDGRLTDRERADQTLVSFGYDPVDNLTSVTPPGQPSHVFTYTPNGDVDTYNAPDTGTGPNVTSYDYAVDRLPTAVIRPDGTTIGISYDLTTRRMDTITLPSGTMTFGFDPTTDRLESVTSPDGISTSYMFDGRLLTDTTWTGAVAGSVNRTYDNFFRLETESVNGADVVSFGYDADGLLTTAGDLSLVYDPQNTLLRDTTVGTVADTRTYNAFGDLDTYSATAGATPLYSFDVERDPLGRIIQKTETTLGVTRVTEYGYDDIGRLITVAEDGALVREYFYDDNGNREVFDDLENAVTTIGSYDEQDRMLAYGTFSYTYTENGSLESKTDTATGETTTYNYDALGNLLTVNLPDGRTISYLIDGDQRRVMKLVDDVPVKGWLYRDDLRIVAELDGSGAVVSRFVWADGTGADEAPVQGALTRLGLGSSLGGVARSNAPAYMVRDGNVYRILTDHLGTPHLVVDAATGAVMQELVVNEWGQVITDTNPGFVPFGFATGLYDPDTGLVRFGARDYDAETGRWTAKDPIRFGPSGEMNLYVYVDADPVNRIDLTGLHAVDPECIAQAQEGCAQGCATACNPSYCFNLCMNIMRVECTVFEPDDAPQCVIWAQDTYDICVARGGTPALCALQGARAFAQCIVDWGWF